MGELGDLVQSRTGLASARLRESVEKNPRILDNNQGM